MLQQLNARTYRSLDAIDDFSYPLRLCEVCGADRLCLLAWLYPLIDILFRLIWCKCNVRRELDVPRSSSFRVLRGATVTPIEGKFHGWMCIGLRGAIQSVRTSASDPTV